MFASLLTDQPESLGLQSLGACAKDGNHRRDANSLMALIYNNQTPILEKSSEMESEIMFL